MKTWIEFLVGLKQDEFPAPVSPLTSVDLVRTRDPGGDQSVFWRCSTSSQDVRTLGSCSFSCLIKKQNPGT